MKKHYSYQLSALGKSRQFGFDRATPCKPGPERSYNTFGFTGQPLHADSLAALLAEFKKLTGVELSHSRVYREVVSQEVSASVVPAWPGLRHATLQPARVAVVLISRMETDPVRQA